MAAGGVILPPATYFEKVRYLLLKSPMLLLNLTRTLRLVQVQAVLKQYDILFIVDEVVSGFGRLGTLFGSDKYNIKPDLVTLAKVVHIIQ